MKLRPSAWASHRAHITLALAYFDGNDHQELIGNLLQLVRSVNPSASVVLASKRISPLDLRGASRLLKDTLRICPKGIHLGLIHPTVENLESRNVVIQCRQGLLLGPDNGILMPAVRELGLAAAYEVSDPRFWPSPPSRTGGAIEACVSLAAYISQGLEPKEAGRPLSNLVEMRRESPWPSSADPRTPTWSVPGDLL